MAETKTSGEPKPSKNLLPPSARMPSPIRSPNRPSAHSAKPSVEQGRYQGLQAILGRESLLKLQKTKVLVVGAGGIGCELLKDLVLSGFESIHVIDLDTIDLSNLNRQFLFQKQHIKKPKAIIARESVLKFNPNANIKAYHASIFEDQFDLEWFQSFDLVLNALDNLAARRHVNKMCLAADVPLVESGTAGYLGQVTVHKKDRWACYDCTPKEREKKTFPVCTIRSTPSEPIHCIVWAKSYLFSNLFGKNDEEDESMTTDVTPKEEVDSLRKEAEALKAMKALVGKKNAGRKIFQKVFQIDIERLLSMEDLWKARSKPKPLVLSDLEGGPVDLKDRAHLDFDQKVWTLKENIHIFLESVEILGDLFLKKKQTDPDASLEFDKDDEVALNFVTATANLRAQIYKIEQKSRFVVKQMAGNIIPAIATTNAIVAGMIVILATKIVTGQIKDCKYTYLAYGGDRAHYLMNEPAPAPNPQCPVCTNAYLSLTTHPDTTLQQVLDRLGNADLKPALSGEFTIQEGERLLYDVEYEDHLESTLSGLGLKEGSQLLVTNDHDDDERKNHSLVLFLRFEETKKGDIVLGGDLERLPTRPPPLAPPPDDQLEALSSSKKRGAVESPARSPASKKAKVINVDDEFAPIEID